ncbi:hypothetical protein HDU87_002388 [Geranomyces variabilis]|uniref:Uncharacterized protein n=1 Tax=Geranomyces variabilis TaxID=109894 RepID=A0AAD5TNF3_9FUNG|nr:hypothetical protein HDU87_002388 [Geranomyces variabilis]
MDLLPGPQEPSHAMEMERSLSLLQDKCAGALAEDDNGGAEADLLKLQAFIKECCGSKDSPLVQFIERVVERLKADRACDPMGDEDEESHGEESHEEEAEDVDLSIVGPAASPWAFRCLSS